MTELGVMVCLLSFYPGVYDRLHEFHALTMKNKLWYVDTWIRLQTQHSTKVINVIFYLIVLVVGGRW